jgi:hypothetical protein
MFHSTKYAIDLVFCIDATSDMQCIIEPLKTLAPELNQKLRDKITDRGREIDQLRVKVIAFRDYWADAPDVVMVSSEFFKLPEEVSAFSSFINGIYAHGGGDEPESALEALALAIQSPWETSPNYVKQRHERHVIALLTDASAHALEREPKPSHYPNNIPKTFDELTDKWNEMSLTAKRLLLFAPETPPWLQILDWENVLYFPSRAGMGLADFEIEEILDGISYSI